MKDLLKLRRYLMPHMGLVIGAGLLAIPLAGLRAAPAGLIKYFIDGLTVSRDSRLLYMLPALFIGLYAINFVVRFFHYYLLRIVVTRVNLALRRDLYQHLLGLSADFFTTRSSGGLISRISMDPQLIDGAVAAINILLREPFTFLFLLSGALYLNWQLTIIVFLIFPPLAWLFAASGRNLKRYIGKISEENAGIFGILQETLSGIRVVKVFQLESYVFDRFLKRIGNYGVASLKTARMEEVSHPVVELLTAFLIAIILYFGSRQVLEGQMTPGDLLAFFAAFMMMMNPIRLLNDVNIKLSAAEGAAQRIMEVFSWKSTLHESPTPVPLSQFKKEIRFENVRFTYPDAPEREVLRGISFTLSKGENLALVGPSGSGKSSIVGLLPRAFDVSGGRIVIDGTDIRELKLDDLRSHIAVVSQDVFLFNDTIEKNILCGRLTATTAEVVQAAKRAHAWEFIQRLPDGLATVIGDRGQTLSGGERQRLAIARAFLREAPILILDEATSSLDHISEKIVQEALEELMVGRTTIVIAHRLSTIRNAARIMVIREGLVVESGTHEELLAKEGDYAKLHALG